MKSKFKVDLADCLRYKILGVCKFCCAFFDLSNMLVVISERLADGDASVVLSRGWSIEPGSIDCCMVVTAADGICCAIRIVDQVSMALPGMIAAVSKLKSVFNDLFDQTANKVDVRYLFSRYCT